MKEYVPLLQTALWVALALIGLALFRRPLVDRIRLGGSVKAGPFELGDIRDKVADMQRQVSDLNDKVAKLFLLTMAPPMYANLRKLASGRFGEYEDASRAEAGAVSPSRHRIHPSGKHPRHPRSRSRPVASRRRFANRHAVRSAP